MKKITLVLFSLIILKANAQETAVSSQQKNASRFKIGINISPDLDYRTLHSDRNDEFFEDIIKDRNERETYKFGYSTGINLMYALNDKINLETALQYSNKGYKTKFMHVALRDVYYTEEMEAQYTYSYHYLDIPVKINYTFGTNKLRYVAGIGVVANILLADTYKWEYKFGDRTTSNSRTSTSEIFSTIGLSPIISLGIDYRLNERMNIKVEPTFRYSVYNTANTSITENLWNAGLNISYYISL